MKKSSHIIEKMFEKLLWKSRLIILLAVIFGVIAAAALFLTGSYEIYHTISSIIIEFHDEPNYSKLLIGIIGAIDLYLIGIVLLIFSFGIYELFVSQIDDAHSDEHPEHSILEISSLDELKNKLLKVILMVLIVNFFKTLLNTTFQTPLELIYMAISILAVAACSFFISNIDHGKDH